MANTQQEVLSVGTLNKDASLFFNQMENLIGSSRLQHTPSMMTLPAGFLQQVFTEQDELEEDEENNIEQQPATARRRHGHGRGSNDDEKKLDEEEENDYEFNDEDLGTDDEFDNEEPLTIKVEDEQDDQENAGDADEERIEWDSPRSPSDRKQPQFGRWSKKKEKPTLSTKDSEGYELQSAADTTPIVRPMKVPRSSLSASDLAGTRRRSDGFSQNNDGQHGHALITKFRPSQKAKSTAALQHIDDDEHGDEDDEEREELELIEEFLNDDTDDHDFLEDYHEEERRRSSVKKARGLKLALNDNRSLTMQVDMELWRDVGDDENGNNSKFTECNIRFEEDDWIKDGRKPPASEFCSLRFFFQFVYDRFHLYSQFLLDTSLPMYSEWKKMRSVRYRNASLKAVDYALKSCIQCVDSIKAVVRNCLILFIDEKQPETEQQFEASKQPKIPATNFNVGIYSIMAAWDLFDNGSTPSIHDWSIALSLDNGGNAQKMSSFVPDLSHLHAEMKSVCLAYHNGQRYKLLILSEFLHENASFLKFGGGPIEWKFIKQKFIEKHGQKYNNDILKAFDSLSYYINPALGKLNDLMSDKNDKFVSKRRIVAEPIMWLYYMVSFLIERQEKLQNLYITAMSFKGDNNNKGQKLNALITNLAKQAKDESERLRAVMAKLPGKDDLKQTLIELVKQRDPNNQTLYAQSLAKYSF